MFAGLPAEIQAELNDLAARYGQPLLRAVELHSASSFNPVAKRDRYGEVCMVVRRRNGRLLTAIKEYYPRGAFRLLTGGIHHGESVFEALLRETVEETGLQTEPRRFLAAISYTASGQPLFYSFAFLLDERSGELAVGDLDEQLEEFREIEPAALPDLAARLAQLPDEYHQEIKGSWHDWGRFRAVIHRAVWEALQQSRP